MAATVLPIAVELADVLVDHFTDTILTVLFPAAFVLVSLFVTVDARSGANTINEVALIDVTVFIVGGTLAGETTR